MSIRLVQPFRRCLILIAFALATHAAAAEKFSSGDWPFRPLSVPRIPAIQDRDWPLNPIDYFVLQKLEDQQLAPNVEADKLVLLRRATCDLWGLPPTIEEQDAFLADETPGAYDRLIDRLLASPKFGERWAQHWLDVVRFTESDGFKTDTPRPEAYRYRDYVIRAFNDDLPYDRFVRQQLAGDELEPDNPEALVATGFLRLYPEDTTASDMRQSWQDILNDVTDVTSLTFLGLTVGCARCHDHKFDAISQKDFYRLQACFAPMVPVDRPLVSESERIHFQQQTAKWEAATASIRQRMDDLVATHKADIRQEVLATYDTDTQTAMNTASEQRSTLQKQLAVLCGRYLDRRLSRAYRRLDEPARAQWDELEKQLAGFDRLKPQPLPLGITIADQPQTIPATFVLASGLLRAPHKGEVQPGFPEFLGGDVSTPVKLVSVLKGSSGRRAEFARWLTRPDHPLTARVIVNRLWQKHLGEGIVGTLNDFGLMGQPATHPELLDWLASELVRNNWQMKRIHRLIMTSATYRQSAQVDAESSRHHQRASQVDEDNHLLWRSNRRRLEGEAVRDAILTVAGTMNPRMAGPSSLPVLPDAFKESRYLWEPDARPADQNRRSVYVFVRRNLRYPLLAAFDAPDGFNSCSQRAETVTVPQSLALFNSAFTQDQAREWAGDLLARFGKDSRGLIVTAIRQAYGRQPSSEEIAAAERFINEQRLVIDAEVETVPQGSLPEPACAAVSTEQAAAVVDFCHALLNSTEFMYVE